MITSFDKSGNPVKLILLLGIMFLFSVVTPGQENDFKPFTTNDALNVRSFRIYDVTDDGNFIAGTIQTRRGRLNVDHMRFGDPTYISPYKTDLIIIDTKTGEKKKIFKDMVQIRSIQWSPDGRILAFFKRDKDEYFLFTYEREKDKVKKLKLKTDKSIASNSFLMWRPDGSGILLALRENEWAEKSRKMYLDLTEGPVIVQDSRKPFLAWEEVRNQSSLQVPAIVDIERRVP